MTSFVITHEIDSPPDTVWEVLDNFGYIANWSPGIRRSALTSTGPVGAGTTRHCDFVPLGGVNERITRYEPKQRMTVHLYETFKMPVTEAVADFQLKPGRTGTVLTLQVEYTPNRLGRVASGATDKQMRKGMNSLVADLGRESERLATIAHRPDGEDATHAES
ncbi:MAG: SRPBCC family protein [Acidimicrobiales bacterium]